MVEASTALVAARSELAAGAAGPPSCATEGKASADERGGRHAYGGSKALYRPTPAARMTAALLTLAAPATPLQHPLAGAAARQHGFTVSTLNVHCPAYRRLPCGDLELNHPERFMERHARILDLPLWGGGRGAAAGGAPSDFVCVQEFWYESAELTELYLSTLSPWFHLHGLQRGHGRRGRCRPDGLLTAVSRAWSVEHEIEIDFADVGDRCAQLLHVRRIADGRELLLLNTHLLFPHNPASHRIQLREVHKALAAVDAYKAQRGGEGRPLPVLLVGDLNSPPRGEVAALLARYGFASSYHECAARGRGGEAALRAVTHRAHTGALVASDYILCANPSSRRAPPRRWTDVVFAELWAHLREMGCRDASDAFQLLCSRDETCVAERTALGGGTAEGGAPCGGGKGPSFSAQAWLQSLTELGLGEACSYAAALSEPEMLALHAHLDRNLNGRIDKSEWAASISQAMREAAGTERQTEGGAHAEGAGAPADGRADAGSSPECAHADFDITPERSVLAPRCLMRGRWPGAVEPGGPGDDGDWVSDHGALTTRFAFVQTAEQLDAAHGALQPAAPSAQGGWGADGDGSEYDAHYDHDRGDYAHEADLAGARPPDDGMVGPYAAQSPPRSHASLPPPRAEAGSRSARPGSSGRPGGPRHRQRPADGGSPTPPARERR